MRLAVLTTDSLHHNYFVREIQNIFPDVTIFLETREIVPAFEVHHPFEGKREEFESQKWFGGKHSSFTEYGPVHSFTSLNEKAAQIALEKEQTDLVVVFGTGRLSEPTIDLCSPNLVNLHGGDPENYRGLDSQLWAIYHRDFASLVATIHRVNPTLDTGDIVLQAEIPIEAGMPLHALRAANTEICVQLTLSAIDMFQRCGSLLSRPQRKMGRYYSSMPTELKSVCERNFARFVAARSSNEA